VGQKVNPIGLRLGINHSWKSRWFATMKDYSALFQSDMQIRKIVSETFAKSIVSDLIIERPGQKLYVSLVSPKPGAVIGKKGSGVDALKTKLDKLTGIDTAISIIECLSEK
jgi:small subunit ribosomal protein S3